VNPLRRCAARRVTCEARVHSALLMSVAGEQIAKSSRVFAGDDFTQAIDKSGRVPL
jgi:hypothetical protein